MYSKLTLGVRLARRLIHQIMAITAFTVLASASASAGEAAIAKLPTFVLAQSAGILAPPILVIGHNNAAPDMLRNLPQGLFGSVESYRGNDFNPDNNYEPPIRVGSTRFPDVSITSAPVDGYAAYYAANLPAGTPTYTPIDYFDGGTFFKNLTTAYKNPLNQKKASVYFFGTAATIDHTQPYFWKEYCPPTPPNPSCGYQSNYWPIGLHVIESNTTVKIYKFKSPLPTGCNSDPSPIVMSCMQLDDTKTSYTNLYQKFANFYSYYSRKVFEHKNEFQYLFNSIPESTTIYCHQFNHTFAKILQNGWPNNPVYNPCSADGLPNGLPNYYYPLSAPAIATALDKEVTLRYLMLSPLGYESGATMDTNSFLGRIRDKMAVPPSTTPTVFDLYYGRKNSVVSTTPPMSVNYCRKVYMYLTDPLQQNAVVSNAPPGGAMGVFANQQFNPAGADFFNPPPFLNSTSSSPYGKHGLYYNNSNEYNGFHKAVIDNVRLLYHADGKQGLLAPNIIPQAVGGAPAGFGYWDSPDPANWQRINTWSLNTLKKEYSIYNSYYSFLNNNYNYPDMSVVLQNAGRSTGKVYDLIANLIADIDKPLISSSAAASGRAAGLTISGQILQDDGVQFGAFYNADGWTGRVEAHKLGSSGGKGDLIWSSDTAGVIPSHVSRSVKTIARTNATGTSGSVVDFAWSNLSAAQQTAMLTPDVSGLVGAGNLSNAGDWLVKYLRGDKTYEQNTTTGTGYFRKRNAPMGDVMGSTPSLIQARDFGYGVIAGAEGTSYKTFLADERAKAKLLAVGANDGMLHLFNATTGSEIFAFVPSAVIPKLGKLAKPSYGHEYYVDGGLLHQHAYLNSTWRSLIIGSAGAGAKSVFVIDVTNRTSPQILFELTSDQVADLGFQFSVPRVARLPNGNWTLVHGNGFESTTEAAKLLVTTLPAAFTANPTVQVVNLPASAATVDNGLAPPAIWNDGPNAEVMYAGDKQGKLWRFNVTNGTVSAAASPLLIATSPSAGSPPQPFTSKPDLALHPQGGLMVFAGTGSIYRSDDPAKKDTQSFYAVWDYPNPAFTGAATRSNLLQQTIVTDGDFRTTTSTPFGFGTKRGWFLDLKLASGADTGERIIASPNVLFGRVMFNTYLPSVTTTGPGCEGLEEKSWFMSLDAFTGAAPSKAIFDINTDGKITAADLVGGAAPSGQKIAATTASVAIGLTYQNQTLTTVASPSANQSYESASGSCTNSATHKNVKQGSKNVCVPVDSCGKGFMWVKAGQNTSDALSSICINSNQQKPRLSWKQVR